MKEKDSKVKVTHGNFSNLRLNGTLFCISLYNTTAYCNLVLKSRILIFINHERWVLPFYDSKVLGVPNTRALPLHLAKKSSY
jgi:hypothetical protein